MTGGRVVVDPAASARRMLLLGTLICGLITLGAVAGAVAGHPALLAVGLFFLAFAILLGYGMRRYATGDRLVFDADGIRCERPDRAWSLRWDELRAARTASAAIPTGASGTLAGSRLTVPCLELVPADPEAAAGRGELAHLWDAGDAVWRCPLSPAGGSMRRAARAIRRFRPSR